MSTSDPEWPPFFEPDTPPANALEMHGVAYRFVTNNPPLDDPDMRSYWETGEPSNAKPWDQKGLSGYRDLEYLRGLKATSKRFRGHHIARAALAADHGKMSKASERTSHVNLWFRRRALAQATTIFVVIP